MRRSQEQAQAREIGSGENRREATPKKTPVVARVEKTTGNDQGARVKTKAKLKAYRKPDYAQNALRVVEQSIGGRHKPDEVDRILAQPNSSPLWTRKQKDGTMLFSFSAEDFRQRRGLVVRQKPQAAAGKYVRADGTTKTRSGEIQPYEISVAEVVAMPADEKLPTMADLYGTAPQATKGKPITKFLKEIRHGW